MTEELIIDGQHVDLGEDSDITLELKSGLFVDFSKLSFSFSYTIKLPASQQNRRIFDDPGNPAHQSSKTRRYLPARYYRNGIDLLGSCQVVVMRETPEDIEIILLPSYGAALKAWSESGETLQDLPLPTIAWRNGPTADFATPETSREIFFGHYDSGLPPTTNPFKAVGAVSHPVVSFRRLLNEINLRHKCFGTLRDHDGATLDTTMLLASTRKPSLLMECASGSQASVLNVFDGIDWEWRQGWDPVVTENYGGDSIKVPASGKLGILLNLKPQDGYEVGPSVPFRIKTPSFEKSYFFTKDENGVEYCSANEILDLTPDETVTFTFRGSGNTFGVTYYPYDTNLPAAALYNPHEHIVLKNQNEFPVALNLPDIKQVDFLKGVCALLGLVAYLDRDGLLNLAPYEDLLDHTGARDWTDKITGEPKEVKHAMANYARSNVIRFEKYENDYNLEQYNLVLSVDDATLEPSADLAKLPFSASAQLSKAVARHYSYTSQYNNETKEYDYTLEDVDITPRVFGWESKDGGRYLNFIDYLAGDKMAQWYAKYQKVIKKPTIIKVGVRLSEIDIASLDLHRPVYLSQTGQYYSVLSIRYTPGAISEAELIQI